MTAWGGVRARHVACAALCLLSAASIAAGLELSYEEVWRGAGAKRGLMPVRVTLENTGRDDRGIVTFRSGRGEMRTPFEISAGSSKSWIAYVAGSYGDNEFEVRSRQGAKLIQPLLNPTASGASTVIGMITDAPGRMSFLRSGRGLTTGSRTMALDVYAAPREAPDRAAGYTPLTVLILDEGSERLSDGEVTAIRRWALSGGWVVFLGGSATPVLSDPRWKGFLPVSGAKASTRSRLAGFAGAPGPFSVSEAKAEPGVQAVMDQGLVASAERQYGFGRALFFAANAFEQPLNTWTGRSAWLTGIAANANGIQQEQLARWPALSLAGFQNSASPAAMPPGSWSTSVTDPFMIQLPDGWLVFWILVGYIVAVVPVHFWILKKLKRENWAWVTAPLISLGFAAIFFSFAAGLYSASLSRADQGVAIMQAGSPDVMMAAKTQFFFPNGGRYDLKLSGVEAALDSDDFTYGWRPADSNRNRLTPSLIDLDGVQAPSVETGSLSFREVVYMASRRQDWTIQARLNATRTASGIRLTGEIVNGGPHEIAGAAISWRQGSVGNLTLPPRSGTPISLDLPLRSQNGQSLWLVGWLMDMPMGSSVGQPSPQSTRVSLVCGLGWVEVQD